MILFQTIEAAVAAEQWCAPGYPYGFAVSDLATAEERLAEVRAHWPELDLDETHVASVEEALKLGHQF